MHVITDSFYNEVLDLHRFLENWLTGQVPNVSGRPERLVNALAEDFLVIQPDGSRSNKSDVIEAFALAYGEKPEEYALQIWDVETRLIGEGICFTTYKESHRSELGRARISTAILRKRLDAGNIEWIFLQETPAPYLEKCDYKQKCPNQR